MFNNLEEVIIANGDSGYKTFDPEINELFDGRIESQLFNGKYFITWESNKIGGGKFYEGYSVRGAFFPTGQIYKVSGNREFSTRDEAMKLLRSLTKKDSLMPTMGIFKKMIKPKDPTMGI